MNKSSILVFMVFLTSCISASKNSKGEYEYWYCISSKGTESEVNIVEKSLLDKSLISGKVSNKSSNEPIDATVSIKDLNSFKTQYLQTDRLGDFIFEIQPGEYELSIFYIGYNSIKSNLILTHDTELIVDAKLGAASGFYTMDIRSKRKLTKPELWLKAKLRSRNF